MNARTKTNVFDLAERTEAETFDAGKLEPYEKMLLAIAGRIAAGLCSNPHTYEQPSWRNAVALDSVALAEKLIMTVRTGGC